MEPGRQVSAPSRLDRTAWYESTRRAARTGRRSPNAHRRPAILAEPCGRMLAFFGRTPSPPPRRATSPAGHGSRLAARVPRGGRSAGRRAPNVAPELVAGGYLIDPAGRRRSPSSRKCSKAGSVGIVCRHGLPLLSVLERGRVVCGGLVPCTTSGGLIWGVRDTHLGRSTLVSIGGGETLASA
jgi:hypothetical protein